MNESTISNSFRQHSDLLSLTHNTAMLARNAILVAAALVAMTQAAKVQPSFLFILGDVRPGKRERGEKRTVTWERTAVKRFPPQILYRALFVSQLQSTFNRVWEESARSGHWSLPQERVRAQLSRPCTHTSSHLAHTHAALPQHIPLSTGHRLGGLLLQ